MNSVRGLVLNDYAPALDVALAAARNAAAVHRRHLGQVIGDDWSEKGVADFVTHVDREAEARILEEIRARFPDHLILAEESADADTNVDGEWLWVVDPLDGTTNFLHQYPVYCASIALLHKGEPVVGVVVSAIGEEFTAVQGGGAFLDGKRLRVSETSRLERCLIGTGFPFKLPHAMDDYLRQFKEISARVSDIRRAGAAALDLCHVAAGYFDGFWEWICGRGITLPECSWYVKRVD